MHGTVRWYSAQGFGFIDSESADRQTFYFHITSVKNRTLLKAGDVVVFDTAPSPKGTKAVNVRRVVETGELECPHPATA